jgi:hypothetical protein
MVVQLDRKRFTTTDFQQMIDSGILQEGEPYELLNGESSVKQTIQPILLTKQPSWVSANVMRLQLNELMQS